MNRIRLKIIKRERNLKELKMHSHNKVILTMMSPFKIVQIKQGSVLLIKRLFKTGNREDGGKSLRSLNNKTIMD